MQSRRSAIQLLLLGAAGAGFGWPAAAQVGDDLTISPKRLVVGPGARAATMFVLNRGATATTYTIEIADRVMLQDGRIRPPADVADKPGGGEASARLKSAKSLITYSPRRITLNPGESQTIRLRVQRPPDLAPGEYRSHLTITAVPPPNAGLTAEQAAQPQPGALSVQILTTFGTSIPVIVRQGERRAAAEIQNVRYISKPGANPAGMAIALDLVRKGESSLYGDLIVRRAGANPKDPPIAAMRGLGVYAEIERRTVEIPVQRALEKGERLQIVFEDEETGTGQVLTSLDYTVT